MRKRFLMVLAAPLLVLGLMTPATAEAAAGDRLEWEPYRTSGFVSPAGQTCSFTLRSEPVVDEEEVAVLARYPDGSPRAEAYRGRLVVRVTNVETGASRLADLSGSAVVHYLSNGAYTMYTRGPVGFGFRPTDHYPMGFYVFDGFHAVYTGPGRTDRRVLVDGGTEHNLCHDLV